MRYKSYDEKTLNHLHEVELTILDDFVKICKDNNLTYFLTGGTMLGAVRHTGFIPWDDDIDIGMPRVDYDKFIKIGPKALGNKYYLECFEYNKKYYMPFAKIKKNNTIFDEGFFKDDEMHKGIYIDIIPFENVEEINLSLKIRAVIVRNIIDTMFYKNHMRKLSKTRRPLLVLLLSLFTKNRLMKIQHYFLTMCKNNNSKYINALAGSYHYLKETNLREDIIPPKEVLFEGKTYNGMNKPDIYLSKLFGNYMALPKEENRINHMPERIVFDTLKEEKYNDKDLKTLQGVLVEILDEVVRICDKHHLDYFISGGTLLGAVRHAGFIPWDDDIDIVMPRDDYEKFLEIAKDELSNKYFLDYYKTNLENHFGFAKIRKNNTTFKQGYTYSCHNGFFLDIFPLDYNDNRDSLKIKLAASLARCLLETLKYKDHNLGLKSLRRPFISLPFTIFSNYRIHRMVDYLYKIGNNGKHKNGAVYSGMYYYKKDIYPIDVVFPYSIVTFEGKKYHAYHNPDAYLKSLYGDYMKLPPKEKQVAHKPEKLDFENGDVKNTKEEYNRLKRK